jgi:hypothetical protein
MSFWLRLAVISGDIPVTSRSVWKPKHKSIHRVNNKTSLWVDMPPGGAVRLHKHPYREIFIVQQG